MNINLCSSKLLRNWLAILVACSFVKLFSMTGGPYGIVLPCAVPQTESRPGAVQVNGNTGHIFTGEVIRSYLGAKKLSTVSTKTQRKPLPTSVAECAQWAVVTTINSPTDGVKSVASLSDWCLVIVGDTRTPRNYIQDAGFTGPKYEDRVHFLSVEDQKAMNIDFVNLMPYRSFARKNIGFLFAIRHGAKVIYDFDDDNVLLQDSIGYKPPLGYRAAKPRLGQSINLRHLPSYVPSNSTPAFNPLPLMRPSSAEVWPRGFPLEIVRDSTTTGVDAELKLASLPLSSVAVVQAVCNQDPDFDAVYRLTRPLPVNFDDPTESNMNLMVPMNSFVSYNAQATTHMYKAFWGLLLPYTVPGRVTDIWRAYFSQRIFHDLGLAVVYTAPLVVHERSAHNYVADMQAEGDLYMKTSALLNFLKDWKDSSPTLPERIENLAIALYERDYIGMADVEAMQAWLLALQDVGYEFPALLPTHAALVPTPIPVFKNQAFTVGEMFNVGGTEGIRFLDYASKYGPNLAKWVADGKALNVTRPKEIITKVVSMTRNEWPFIKDWVHYHGHLLGFENLYILEGSTDSRTIDFLRYARDHLGVNVLYTSANLNQLAGELSHMGREVNGAADFLMKMDVDEYFVMHKASDDCDKPGESGARIKCSSSPYKLVEFLRDYKNIATLPQNARWGFGYMYASGLTKEACDSGKEDMVGHYPLQVLDSPSLKTVADARLVRGLDLGGHLNVLIGHFDKAYKLVRTEFALLHMHRRCLETEIANNRKACLSHGFFSEADSDQVKVAKMLKHLGAAGSDPCNVTVRKKPASWHKMFGLLSCLANCSSCQPENFYSNPNDESFAVNADFAAFLAEANSIY